MARPNPYERDHGLATHFPAFRLFGPPGSSHRLLARPNRFEARGAARVLGAGDRAILVDEQNHALVVYVPRADVDMASLVPLAARRTHCPFKGDAHYWRLAACPGEPVGWSYPTPFPEVAGIAGYIAFYHDRVDVILGTKRS